MPEPDEKLLYTAETVTQNAEVESTTENPDEIDCIVANEIMMDYDKNKALIEDYKKSKLVSVDTGPILAPVENILFNMVRPVLIQILHRMEVENSLRAPKTSFNGLDYISEYCYNSNPRYPERQKAWTYIFDMDWVTEYLKQHPRPYYPLSRLMSKQTAAKYIQAHVRGYWIRRRPEYQEIRQFWKTIKIEKDAAGLLSMTKLVEKEDPKQEDKPEPLSQSQ